MKNSFDTVSVNITNGAIKVKLLSATNKRFSKRLMWTHKDVVYIWHVKFCGYTGHAATLDSISQILRYTNRYIAYWTLLGRTLIERT